jgi:DNA invertase Pin-like site-specific DNA recombinase
MCRSEGWSTRISQGRLDSMLFERTALSRKPDELLTSELASLRDQGVLGPTVENAGAGFLSLTEAIDTTSPAGRMMMQIVDRSPSSSAPCCANAPVAACCPPAENAASAAAAPNSHQRNKRKIVHLVDSGQKTAADSARLFNVHPSTVARLLARSRLTK